MTDDPTRIDPPEPTSRTMPALRASDADRHTTVHVLQDAVTRGLLTSEEGGQRMTAAFAARHLRDLPVLTADLPRPLNPPLQRRAGDCWQPRRGSRPGRAPLSSPAAA